MVSAHGEIAGSVANGDGTRHHLAGSMKWMRQYRMKSSWIYEIHNCHRHFRISGDLQEHDGQAHIHAHEP